MAESITGWKLLVSIFLPIPLLLTLLLVTPFPRNVRKGILLFTHKVLSFTMIGSFKLVHVALFASGLPLLDMSFQNVKHSRALQDPVLRPDVKVTLQAKKWRVERNFWISSLSFTLWCLLSVLYAQLSRMVQLEDQLEALRDEVADLKGEPRPQQEAAEAEGGRGLLRRRRNA